MHTLINVKDPMKMQMVDAGYIWNSYESVFLRRVDKILGIFVSIKAKKPRVTIAMESIHSVALDKMNTTWLYMKLNPPSSTGVVEYIFQFDTTYVVSSFEIFTNQRTKRCLGSRIAF
jgi:hypothetical protein